VRVLRNSILLVSQVGTILGQISIGLLCDYKGRKWGIVLSTICIVVGVILATAAHGSGNDLRRNFTGFIWFLTVARGLTGIGVGGEHRVYLCRDQRYVTD